MARAPSSQGADTVKQGAGKRQLGDFDPGVAGFVQPSVTIAGPLLTRAIG
jgi:hypothetical protein